MTRLIKVTRLISAIFVASTLILTGCNGGLRPTLVEDAAPTPQPPLQLDLPAAPPGTPPLPATAADFPLEASVDDALLSWAADRSIPYLDACALVTPGPGELCDVPTERDTVRLLGPSSSEPWYVVTLIESDSTGSGAGYRVAEIRLAGE